MRESERHAEVGGQTHDIGLRKVDQRRVGFHPRAPLDTGLRRQVGHGLEGGDEFRVPATVKRYSALKHFAGADADERAYRFGMFCLGVYGKKQGIEFCQRQGIPLIDGGGESISVKTQRENVNISSGFLVPDEFQNDLIDLREK